MTDERNQDGAEERFKARTALLQDAIDEAKAKRELFGFTNAEWDEWSRLKKKYPLLAETAVHECAHAVAFSAFGFPVTAIVLRENGSGAVWADRPEPTTETLRQNMIACSVGNCATETICGQTPRSDVDVAMVRGDARRIVGLAAPDKSFDGEILRTQRRARRFIEKYRVDITQLALTLLRFHDRLQQAPFLVTIAELDDNPTKSKRAQTTDPSESKEAVGADAGEQESPAKGEPA